MTLFFEAFLGFMRDIILTFDQLKFELFGYKVSYFSILFVFLIIGFVINVFWRGART